MNVSDMNCYRAGDALLEGGQTYAYCCKEGRDCLQSSWNTALWNGKSVLPGKAEEVVKFSDKIVALRKVFGTPGIWTSSPYDGGNNENCCAAFYVNVSTGTPTAYYRYNGHTVLCQ